MGPDFFEFGRIQKTHGNFGFLKGIYLGRHPEQYQKLESVFLQMEEGPVPFFFEELKWQDNQLMLRFKDINRVEQASALVGKSMLLPADQLPELEEDDFFLHDLLGKTVIDEQMGELGKVMTYFDQTSQPMIEIDHKGDRLLIPLVDAYIKGIDLSKDEIVVNLPEGYIDSLIGKE